MKKAEYFTVKVPKELVGMIFHPFWWGAIGIVALYGTGQIFNAIEWIAGGAA